LTLVYNPPGPSLPPAQAALEADYRRELRQHFGVVFNQLYTLTNMPIGRFLAELVRSGRHAEYFATLADAFDPDSAAGVMCRRILSVDWTGRLYDCDFNQALGRDLAAGLPRHIADFDLARLARREIVTGPYCYGCTAGAGSGCQGAIQCGG
jgi:radical SAM/Cys-rich protein